jgi:hypothetical protein
MSARKKMILGVEWPRLQISDAVRCIRSGIRILMLSSGKPPSGLPISSSRGVKKIDEVYGRRKRCNKLPNKQLDLVALFRNFRALPPFAISKARSALPEVSHKISS